MYKKITPLFDKVLIRRINHEEKTKGGIIIPDNAKEEAREGEVIEIGSGKLMENGKVRKPTITPGQKVLFAKYSETEILINDIAYLLIREEDILAIVS